MDTFAPIMNIIIFLLSILGIIGAILGIPFIIYGAIKKKKSFIISGAIGLATLPVTLALYGITNLIISD